MILALMEAFNSVLTDLFIPFFVNCLVKSSYRTIGEGSSVIESRAALPH